MKQIIGHSPGTNVSQLTESTVLLILIYVCWTNWYSLYNYYSSCVQYVAEPENSTLLIVAVNILRKFNKPAAAMRLAMQLNDLKLIRDIFFSCNNESVNNCIN